MSIGLPRFVSATPAGIMQLLKRYGVGDQRETRCGARTKQHCRKTDGDTPNAEIQPRNCTVTVYHSATPNIKEICLNADIIVAALGQPGFVTADMVKPGATIIDVGTTRVEDASRKSGWRLRGDVDFENVAEKCEFITPVPVVWYHMTICSLMINTLRACKDNPYK